MQSKASAWDHILVLGPRSDGFAALQQWCSGRTRDGVSWVVKEGEVTLQIFDDPRVIHATPYLRVTASASGVKFELPKGEAAVQAEYYTKICKILRALQVSVDSLSVPLSSGAKMLVLLANVQE